MPKPPPDPINQSIKRFSTYQSYFDGSSIEDIVLKSADLPPPTAPPLEITIAIYLINFPTNSYVCYSRSTFLIWAVIFGRLDNPYVLLISVKHCLNFTL